MQKPTPPDARDDASGEVDSAPAPTARKKRKKRRKRVKQLLQGIAPWIVAPALYLLSRTWKVKIAGDPEGCDYLDWDRRPPCVFGLWHSDDLTLGSIYARRHVGIIISLSSDGELIARTLRLLGFAVFRGSSSRAGAKGLLGMIRHVRDGHQACITVDGPRGPLHRVKPGVAEIARKSGTPVVPIGTFASRAWRFPKTWNQAYIPKPFATVTVICNAPIFMETQGADDVARADHVRRVQEGLDAIGRMARETGVAGA